MPSPRQEPGLPAVCACGHERREHHEAKSGDLPCYHVEGRTTHFYCECRNFRTLANGAKP